MKKLEWDSIFFNKSIYEIDLDKIDVFNPNNDIDLIYIKSSKDFNFNIPSYIQTFEELKIEFVKCLPITNQQLYVDEQIKSYFSLEDKDRHLEELYRLAYISGENSRFLQDARFGREAFEKLYRKWIDNSLNRSIANDLFVYEENSKIFGFITVRVNNFDAQIGLLAVDPSMQGKRIGTKLLHKVENYLVQMGVNRLSIPTQATNTKACNFYRKSGYNVENKIYIKHYWKYDTI